MSELSAEDATAVSEFYALGSVEEWAPNQRGLINVGYEIPEHFFLTVYSGRTADELEAVARVANGMPEAVPIARPIPGRHGYAAELTAGYALLTPHLPGEHYVGIQHTQKHPIPDHMHRVFAGFFWDVQEGLSAAPEQFKAILKEPSRSNKSTFPEEIPPVALALERFAPEDGLDAPAYPDLIHDDMERQNILCGPDEITGLVDLDSIHQGDVLYEYSHFLFNVGFCDPWADFHTVSVYLDKMHDAGVIAEEDVPAIYGQMYRFAMADIAEFQNLIEHSSVDSSRLVDLEVLAHQYERALRLANRYFRSEYSLP